MADVGTIVADVHVYCGNGTSSTAPSTWVEIPNITNIPDMGIDPDLVDVTPVSVPADGNKVNVAGLKSYDIITFEAMFTDTLADIITAAVGYTYPYFKVEFESALKEFAAPCTFLNVYPSGGAAGDALKCNVRVLPTDQVVMTDMSVS